MRSVPNCFYVSSNKRALSDSINIFTNDTFTRDGAPRSSLDISRSHMSIVACSNIGCGRTFTTTLGRNSHLRSCHHNQARTASSVVDVTSLFLCGGSCSYSFQSARALSVHRSTNRACKQKRGRDEDGFGDDLGAECSGFNDMVEDGERDPSSSDTSSQSNDGGRAIDEDDENSENAPPAGGASEELQRLCDSEGDDGIIPAPEPLGGIFPPHQPSPPVPPLQQQTFIPDLNKASRRFLNRTEPSFFLGLRDLLQKHPEVYETAVLLELTRGVSKECAHLKFTRPACAKSM